MSLLGVLLGKPGTPIPQPAPPAPPPVSAGPAPLSPAAAGADSGSASGADGGSTPGTFATTPPATASATVPYAAAAAGTPITAPATRRTFRMETAATTGREDEARAHALKMQRQWRLADVFAAIGGGPRAERLIEAASRPGPVEPGSLTEALKALCPQPTLQTSRTV